MRAAAYFRVSTPGQAKEDRHSLPAQQEDAQAWCDARGLVMVGAYEDHETGTKQGREHFQEMFTAARNGAFEVVLVREFSRFARDRWGAMARLGELMALGIEVHEFGTGNVITKDDETSFLLSSVKAHSADSQAAEIRRNSKRGQVKAIDDGRAMGRVPFGYRKEGKTFVPSEQAVHVREMFQWYDDNDSLRDIAKRLNALEVRTATGKHWDASTVSFVLSRTTYMGDHQWGESCTPVEPLVDRETFMRVQERRARKASISGRAQKSDYLLTGILRCGHCKGAMQGWSHKKKGTRRYLCGVHHKSGNCQYRNSHQGAELERIVLETLQDERGDPRAVRKAATDEVARLEQEIAGLRAERSHYEDRQRQAIKDFLRSKDDQNIYEEVRKVAADQIGEVDRDLDRLSGLLTDARRRAARAHLIPAQARTLTQALTEMPVQQAKGILQSLVVKVEVWDKSESRPPDLYL